MKSLLPSNLSASRALAILAAILTTQTQAILDTNANLLSDLWEKQHNNDNLFLPSILATNDEDQDGWTNAQEAAAGTDPFNPNPPDGIVTVTITPSLTAGAFTLTWPTLIGKNYQLKVSTDLTTWTNLGDPITSYENSHSIGINTIQPDTTIPPKVFWRVEVTDLDSDLDGLTNSEELNLGTDPFNPDTDGDDLSDFIEFEIGTDPLNSDSDNNGVPDSAEDTDGDGIKNSEDADPADNIVNWQRTGRPTFAVIEIPVEDSNEVHYIDHSENGTILLRRGIFSDKTVIIDKQQNVKEIASESIDLEFTGIWQSQLHDDLAFAHNNKDGQDNSLYDPLTGIYSGWECPTNYVDSISDVRNGFVIGRYWRINGAFASDDRLRRGINGDALPGQEAQPSVAAATIDKEGNIASVSHYWKKEANGSYTAQNYSTAHQGQAKAQSAIHSQIIAGVEKKWTLVARPGTPGLQISQDDATFASATKRYGAKRFNAVTRQGWIIDENNRFWTGDKWETLLDILGQDYTEAELLGLNDDGLAVAKIKKESGPMKIGLLIPVEIGVDNNRDGTLELSISEDQTSELKPYRFWLNNDHDNYGGDTYNAADDHPWTTKTPDNNNGNIEPERDLEDFARIHLKIEGIRPALEAGTMTLGFKWKSVQAGVAKIRLFKAADIDGGTKYLSDTAKAADQVSLGSSALGTVEGTVILDLPASYWTSTASSPTKYFLYEGLGEGKGELSIVIKKGNTVIGEGGSVFLEILDIRKMYEQWGIHSSAVIHDPDRDVLLSISGVTAVSYQAAPHVFKPAWDENLTDKNYLVCVHGWRKGGVAAANPDDFYKGRSDEITMFKRLWHRGFKGRYIGFIWPTYDVTVTSSIPLYGEYQSALQSKFDYSEYRAWKCGEAFRDMVNGLPAGYKRKVMAHSLGNVVVGSALEKGLIVDNYALLNAAISARCYHQSAPTPINNSKDDMCDDATAAVRALSYRGDSATVGHARLENVGGKLSNFYLPDDFALSGDGGWEDGQYLKPIKEYEYNNAFGSSSVFWDSAGWTNRVVTDPHEAMAMANISHSKAVGSAPVLAGAGGMGIDTNIDMNGPGMGFKDAHQAAFEWRCSKTWEFYSKLWDELNLPGTKAP